MPQVNDPTTGFQLSALPQPFEVPQNIGKFDVGQTQQAYAQSLKNVQNTALVGPETQAAISQAKYQQAKNQQLMNLLSPEEATALAKLKTDKDQAELNSLIIAGQKPTAEQLSKWGANLQLQDTINQYNYKKMFGSMFGDNTQPLGGTTDQTQQVGPLSGAPSTPSNLTTPNTNISNYLFGGQPSSLTGALGSFSARQNAQNVQPQGGELSQGNAKPLSVQQTQGANAPISANIQTDQFGNPIINGVTVPARMANNPLIQNYINSGYEPQGSPFEWSKIDTNNLTRHNIAIAPNGSGIVDKGVQPLQKSTIDQINQSKDATRLAQQIDPNYQEDKSFTNNINKAASVYAAPKINNNNQVFPAVNPAANFRNPVQAEQALAKAKDAGLKALDSDNDLHNDVVKLRSDLQEYLQISKDVATGLATGGKLAQLTTGLAGNLSNFISSLTGDDKKWVDDPTNAAKLQRLQQLHNTLIPSLVRSMNGKATSASTQTGGSSGLGRLMVNELPWLSSGSPDPQLLNVTNNAQIYKTLNSLDKIDDFTAYRNQFFNDFGHLEGSTGNFRKAEQMNPYFNDDGSINTNRKPWNEVLMSKSYNDNPDHISGSTANNYKNVFYTQAPKTDTTPAPAASETVKSFIDNYKKSNPNATAQDAWKAYQSSLAK